MAAQKTPIQKTYKINIGTESVNIDFLGSNRQFDWIELSLANDKSDKHTTICDSYNVELATKTIKICETFQLHLNLQLDKRKKYGTDNFSQKYLL